MDERIKPIRRPVWAWCVGACLVCPMLASDDVENTDGTSSDHGDSGETDIGPQTDRAESWDYIQIPHHGLAPMQDLLDETSDAYAAWESIGEPLESYESVSVHAMSPSVHNGAVNIRMLPQRCLGDYNNDGRVDSFDLTQFLDAYLNEDLAADLSRDGRVDIRDQLTFVLLTTMPCVDAWGL